ncbi:MAG TPA: hypothetical protein VF059_12730 [Casimicrobiaceae bacterium]
MSPRSLACAAASVLVALAGGCATIDRPGDTSGPVAAAPTLAVGARWTYRGREGFRSPVVWEETHEVTGIGADGISVRVTLKGPSLDVERHELLAAPGLVRTGALMDIETRRFATPLVRYRFPLAPGETWNQWVDNFNERLNRPGQINRYVRVGGWEKVSTPAGTFDAIRMRVLMRLDDDEFWRYPTTCNYLIWYAPAVGAPVREEKEAEYRERGENMDGTGTIRAQHTLLELVAYSPGRG